MLFKSPIATTLGSCDLNRTIGLRSLYQLLLCSMDTGKQVLGGQLQQNSSKKPFRLKYFTIELT